MHAALYGVLGTNLTRINGPGPSFALTLVAEGGTDLLTWKSGKHVTSWLCLEPGNQISPFSGHCCAMPCRATGGELLSSRIRRSSSRAAALLRLAATTIGRSETALGPFYRRLSSRIGKQKAVTAKACKIAVLFYNAVHLGMAYHDPGAAAYEERHRTRVLAKLQRRAKTFGFEMAPSTAAQAVA